MTMDDRLFEVLGSPHDGLVSTDALDIARRAQAARTPRLDMPISRLTNLIDKQSADMLMLEADGVIRGIDRQIEGLERKLEGLRDRRATVVGQKNTVSTALTYKQSGMIFSEPKAKIVYEGTQSHQGFSK